MCWFWVINKLAKAEGERVGKSLVDRYVKVDPDSPVDQTQDSSEQDEKGPDVSKGPSE
jgi:hypothetical protein